MPLPRYPVALALLALAGLLVAGDSPQRPPEYPDPIPLRISGLLGNATDFVPISPADARDAAFLTGSSVLRFPSGDLRYLPPGSTELVTVPPDDPGAAAAVEESRRWLDRGTVPGESNAERRVAERALLDLRLLTRPNGAPLAAPHPRWDLVWPRDAGFVAAAFAATGHYEESYAVLRFLADVQEPDGAWEARYRPDGSPVLDGRPPQLDATGWFPWAVWFHTATGRPEADVRELWPAVRRSADAAADSLGRDGLPPGGADYWEIETRRPNLGTAAPLLAGLRSAADLAARLGYDAESRRYAAAADRLGRALDEKFAPHGYPRTTGPRSGADAAVNFLAPPFAPPDPGVQVAVGEASEALTVSNGGVVPGERWPQHPEVSWTPQTALFGLSAASFGDEEESRRRLGWLVDHRTSLGSFPEKVDGEGELKSVAPLAWTAAVYVLALAALEEPLPVPPDRPPEHLFSVSEGPSSPVR